MSPFHWCVNPQKSYCFSKERLSFLPKAPGTGVQRLKRTENGVANFTFAMQPDSFLWPAEAEVQSNCFFLGYTPDFISSAFPLHSDGNHTTQFQPTEDEQQRRTSRTSRKHPKDSSLGPFLSWWLVQTSRVACHVRKAVEAWFRNNLGF